MHSFVLAAAFVALAAPAHADPAGMRAAIMAMDVESLKLESASETEHVRELASAIEQSWKKHDAVTAANLIDATSRQTDPSLKAAGNRALMSLFMRRGEFSAAVRASHDANTLEPLDAGELQAQVFVQALENVSPTRAIGKASGVVPIKRDLAGLMRSDIRVGDQSVGAILDTGANFSTINETSAQRLGLRMLESSVSVGSSSRDAVASRLGVADRLEFGGAVFSNVIFIVLPDADLSFANGAYTIDAILGMPVFLEMKRIEITKIDGREVFAFGDEAAEVEAVERNILFNAMSPMAQLSIDVAGEPVGLSMLLDSGAQRTSFGGAFAQDAAALLVDAETVSSTRGGAGGMVTSDTTKRLATANITLGAKSVTLENVDVHVDDDDASHGILGLDVLRDGFVIDWDAGVVAPH
jgi:predicted aspartyl protease